MRPSLLAWGAAAFAAAALAVWWRDGEPEAVPDSSPATSLSAAPSKGPAGGGVSALPTAPPASRPVAPVARASRPAPPPSLYGDFLKAREYRSLYERLQGTPEGATAEGRLVLYEILRQCANVVDGRRWNRGPAIPASPPTTSSPPIAAAAWKG